VSVIRRLPAVPDPAALSEQASEQRALHLPGEDAWPAAPPAKVLVDLRVIATLVEPTLRHAKSAIWAVIERGARLLASLVRSGSGRAANP
jgi:hypothetical protein